MVWFARTPPSRAEICRRQHERWLTRALATGLPSLRIPVRRVDRGGFSRLMARESGRRLALEWWSRALRRVSLDEET